MEDQTKPEAASHGQPEEGLYLAEETMRIVWPSEKSRPSYRTFDRWRKAKIIPSIKLNSLRYYSPAAVKAALLARQTGGIPNSTQSQFRNN